MKFPVQCSKQMIIQLTKFLKYLEKKLSVFKNLYFFWLQYELLRSLI